jgi:hypothetical protein
VTAPAHRIDVADLPAPTEGFLVTLFITVRKVARSRDLTGTNSPAPVGASTGCGIQAAIGRSPPCSACGRGSCISASRVRQDRASVANVVVDVGVSEP